jgi:zinc transporter
MKKDDALIFAYLISATGATEKLNLLKLKKWKEEDGLLWLHIASYNHSKLNRFFKNHSIPPLIVEALTEDGVRSRTTIYPEAMFTCLKLLNLNVADEEDMVSVRLFYKHNLIITAMKREIHSLKPISDKYNSGVGPKDINQFMIQLSDIGTEPVLNFTDKLIDSVDEIEEEYLRTASSNDKDVILNIRKKIVILKRHLSPQKEALKILSSTQMAVLNQETQQFFHETYEKIARILEELELLRERCSLLQEQMSNRQTEELNRRMYLFSLITSIFFPISAISGLFGMNLGGIPGSDKPWAFSLATVLLGGLSFTLLYVLRKKKWF